MGCELSAAVNYCTNKPFKFTKIGEVRVSAILIQMLSVSDSPLPCSSQKCTTCALWEKKSSCDFSLSHCTLGWSEHQLKIPVKNNYWEFESSSSLKTQRRIICLILLFGHVVELLEILVMSFKSYDFWSFLERRCKERHFNKLYSNMLYSSWHLSSHTDLH